MTAATANGVVTASEVVEAINFETEATGVSAVLNDEGAIVLTSVDGATFTLDEDITTDVPAPVLTGGFENDGSTPTSYEANKVAISSDSIVVFEGVGIETAGLNNARKCNNHHR